MDEQRTLTTGEWNLQDVGKLQNALRSLLDAYVNGGLLRRASQYGYPVHWQLSAWKVREAIHDLERVTLPLRNSPYPAQLLAKLEDQAANVARSPEAALGETIVQGYRSLKQMLVEQDAGIDAPLPEEKPFCAEHYLTVDKRRFRPVVALANYTTINLSEYLSDAWIHGSVADMGLAGGYSDLDVLYVLAEETVADSKRLQEFARRCYRARPFLYAFDPLQHHGFQVSTAIDWLAYPESWLPLRTLSEGAALLRRTKQVRVRDSRADARDAFSTTVDYFLMQARRGWAPANAFEAKNFLSILMLLPTLFLQAQGEYETKRESFGRLARIDGKVDSSVIKQASRIRDEWPELRAPYAFRFVHPKVLSAWFPRRARRALAMFPHAIVADAAAFAAQLYELTAGGGSERITCAGSPAAVINDPVQYALSDYAAARSAYVEHVANDPAVMAVFEYGTVSEPGLSDLDFAVLVDDSVPIKADALSIHALSIAHADLIMHEPVVLPLSLMPSVHEWMPYAQPTVLFSKDPQLEIPVQAANDDSGYAEAARGLEKLCDFSNWYRSRRLSNQLDARWGLATLKSMQYSIASVARISGRSFAAAPSFDKGVRALRSDWFQIDDLLVRHERLRSLHLLGESLLQECIVTMEDWLCSQGWIGAQVGGPFDVLKRMCAIYAREEPLAGIVDSAAGPAPATPFESYLAQRAGILARQQRYLRANALTFGLML